MHHIPLHEALLLLEADPHRGLDQLEATKRLEQFGHNELVDIKPDGTLHRLVRQFADPLIYVLLAATVVTYLLGELVDASVILGVVLITATIGFVQESSAQRALTALATMFQDYTTVIRNGERCVISSQDVVPGDLLALTTGDGVAADARIVEIEDLEIDESTLTGESSPVAKLPAVLPLETVVADRTNMAYAGTMVTHGHGLGVVVATGGQTELGLIHRLIAGVSELDTPLTRKLAHFGKLLTAGIVLLAGVTFAIGMARGELAAEMFLAATALAVGAIPEGLPAAVTITMAIGVRRMARRKAIVRRLPSVETLGSTTVICTDKTGTLTENQMTVEVVVAGGQHFEVSGSGYNPSGVIACNGERASAADTPALGECLLAGVLCGNAHLVHDDIRWSVVGDPTEGALIVAARKGGVDPKTALAAHPRLDELPFQARNRLMATLNARPDNQAPTAHVKGAVEGILPLCSSELDRSGALIPIDNERALATAGKLAQQGLRVLAFATAEQAGDKTMLDEKLARGSFTLLGLQAMSDPPRREAMAAVRTCHAAGIDVKMVTGDHATTAVAVAQRVGLGRMVGTDGVQPQVMTGDEIAACPPETLAVAVANISVFARVSPEQKLRLVEALQADGQIVAMTGDGVNDAPALKQADIGIAMGRGGTEAAREAADVVLADDNFATIEAAVEEGRRISDNLTKFILWTLPTNIGEGLLIFAAVVAGVALPILPVQILWINMTTAVALGLTLAFEPPEPGLMKRPPRGPLPLLTNGLITRMVTVGVLLLIGSFSLFEWERASGASVAEARTVAVNLFVAVELFYLLSCRSLDRSAFKLGLFSNRWLNLGVVVMIGLQAAFTYWPPLGNLFHTAPIGWGAWLRILGVAGTVWAVIGCQKWIHVRQLPPPTASVTRGGEKSQIHTM